MTQPVTPDRPKFGKVLDLLRGTDWATRWEGPDRGLITAWLAGKEMAAREPSLAERARSGELVELPFRGGVLKKIKSTTKVGHLLYVAMWKGLRGDELDLEPEDEVQLVCARFDVPVLFTMDIAKNFAQPPADQ